MERHKAVKRLRMMLGKDFAYEIRNDAPTPEQRQAAKERQPALTATLKTVSDALEQRRKMLLDSDHEYQMLLKRCEQARKARDDNAGDLHLWKISVGTANSLFFHVAAQADSWEGIFEQLKKRGEQ